jgi:MFS family permease
MAQITRSIPMQIWFVGVLFVLFQFFLQLSSGVVIGVIMQDMSLSALTAGALSAIFYVVYTGLQIPVGMLFDRKNPRMLIVISTLLCSLGCFTFASSYHICGLFIYRTIMGIGASFAFVGLSHLLRQHFPARQFAFMIGLSETIGFVFTVVGIISMGALIHRYGWRTFITCAGLMGVFIAILAARIIPSNTPQHNPEQHYKQHLLAVVKNKKLWINGLFIGLTFMLVTVFGAMWAASFIQIKLHCTLREASLINALFFLGVGFSCPLFGWLSTRLARRKPLMLLSLLTTTGLFFLMLYYPTTHHAHMGIVMFLMGLACGAYILAYPIANELAPPGSSSTCTGFINTLAVLTTPIMQPLIGYCLDTLHKANTPYSLSDYQNALLVIPLALLIACLLVCYLPEKPLGDNEPAAALNKS